MCGICGIVWADPNREVPIRLLAQMTSALVHRGPDGAGLYQREGVGLGHRRLSVIDLEGGTQPMTNEDKSVWVVFNGEIYNFFKLRRQLMKQGHTFTTSSDTEVLVHLWEEDGPAMVEKLRGMFALALWDEKTRTLFFARDRLGKKPLVYRVDADGLRLASELKSILVDRSLPRELDLESLDLYLTYQYVPAPRSILKGYAKLPPAHRAIYRDGKLTVERYWRPSFTPMTSRSWEEDRELVRETLTQATKMRLHSDVPLGAFLSGGIDSTIIVGLMQKLAGRPIKTFSIGFPIPEYDETSFARLASKHLGTEHHEFIIEPDAVNIVEKLGYLYDEPFADSSAVPTYYVSEATRREVTVALTGDGGDELFLGYDRYEAVRLAEGFDRWPSWLRRLATMRLWQKLPAPGRQKSLVRRAKRLVESLGQEPRDRYRQWVTIFDRARRERLYAPAFGAGIDSALSDAWLNSLNEGLGDCDFLTQTSAVDVNSYLPMDILTKVDMASMAHGLECRSPMLDHEFVDLVAGLPVDRKMQGRRRKVLLKEAFSEFLPPEIERRGKMGFGVPLDHWFRRELRGMVEDEVVRSLGKRGWFEPSALAGLASEHASGRWDHSARLWSLLMLEQWARNYWDRPRGVP
jgi:asparagine synthase (glutamine-hydrolysing)